jgi:aromatic ring-opening dioxygenase catalytic subunit (LigB family)
MAELVGIFAATHAPPLIFAWDGIEVNRKQRLQDAYARLGRRITDLRPDAIIAIGADHWTNFFLNNYPALCIGVGEEHDGPPEPWLKDYPHRPMAGRPGLALHLAESCFEQGFEPSLSYRLTLDHAFCVPFWKAGLDPLPPIVPVILNVIQPPLPAVARCVAFGAAIAAAVRSYSAADRVVILATGGLSHAVGEPGMGDIDEPFDRGCIERFEAGDTAALVKYLSDERMARAGNGSAELRFWAAAHGAAASRGFELMYYEAVPETGTGCGLAEWRL